MRSTIKMRTFVSLLLTCCPVADAVDLMAKKGDSHLKKA